MKWKYQHVKIIIQTLFKIAPLCPDFAFEMLKPAFGPEWSNVKVMSPLSPYRKNACWKKLQK